jgi:hypothetical protein
MGKNQSASNLTNIIKQDANGNITFVSGSTTLMSVSSSGAIATTGNVAGTASYASNAELLDGLDSTVFTLTSSFAAQTASFTAFTSSVNTFSASILSYTASQNVLNGKYATTGSNTFAGIQTVNSNLIVTGSITAQTLVVQTITSSVDFVTGSTRFGSLSSNTHIITGSMYVTGAFYVTTGSVGIGTISPSTKLDVGGSIRAIGQGDATSGVGAELFYQTTTTSSYLQSYDRTNSAWKDVRIYGNTLHFGSQGTNHLTISSAGNVLIGTTTDSSFGKLQITGLININTSDTTAASTSQQAYDYSRLRVKATNGSNYGLSFGYSGGNYFYLQSCYNEGSTGPMMINPFGGSVNIGTNTPNGNTLQVLGTTSFLGNMDINSGMTMCAQNLGNVTTSWVSTNLTTLYVGFVFVYWANSVSGERNTAVITCNYYPSGVTTISQSNNGGNGVQFQMSGNTLQIKTTSGTAAGVQLVYWKV